MGAVHEGRAPLGGANPEGLLAEHDVSERAAANSGRDTHDHASQKVQTGKHRAVRP